jgi:thioredoxin reductase
MKMIYQWAVIGAGPAGIAAVGKLIDAGIHRKEILWIDPNFQVGDFGIYWQNVSSNTKVALFTKFLEAVKSFQYDKIRTDCTLDSLPTEETCELKYMAEPLQVISDQLSQQITNKKDYISALHLSNQCWSLQGKKNCYYARQVILATGADPISLSYEGVDEVPFHRAIDKEKLAAIVKNNERYAVFGSSHSAIMILKHLLELNAGAVINFYRSPCRYAINMGDWILFDNTGLKAKTADWAKNYIDGKQPENLARYLANEANIAKHLPTCDKVIYAVGFQPRHQIQMSESDVSLYNDRHGIIAPGLFGFGIAYPEAKTDPFGHLEHQVGLWKFMCYLEKILPIWLRYTTALQPMSLK